MKSLVASLALLIGVGAILVTTLEPAHAHRYYYHGRYYPYRYHGRYYVHRHCYSYHHCRYW